MYFSASLSQFKIYDIFLYMRIAAGTRWDSAGFYVCLQSGQLSPATNSFLQSQMACGIKNTNCPLFLC